jgi:endogenous inhibitor of DNA gyrase (YacG/DUF329 family)
MNFCKADLKIAEILHRERWASVVGVAYKKKKNSVGAEARGVESKCPCCGKLSWRNAEDGRRTYCSVCMKTLKNVSVLAARMFCFMGGEK